MAATSTTKRSCEEQASFEKRSLASILRDHGPLGVIDAVDVTLDVCDELANAHANGVVHGDLGLHRVRTVWPRAPGQPVDIFAHGEDDSAAFAFRSNSLLRGSAAAILLSPEQREGRVVDVRADVWAVGAILHWLIAGVPPTNDPVARTLFGAPRALVATVASCLEADPNKRPQSVDEIAQAIGSYAASPPQRFEQLARRRIALESSSKVVREDLGDLDRVLGRLDDAALEREVTAASFAGPMPTAAAVDPLVIAVRRGMKSAVFEKAAHSLADNDGGLDVETVLAQPSYEPDAKRASSKLGIPTPTPSVARHAPASVARQALPNLARQAPTLARAGQHPSKKPAGAQVSDLDELDAETVLAQPPLSIAPVVLSSELLSPPRDLPSYAMPPMMPVASSLRHTVGPRPQSFSLSTALIAFGAIAAIAIGVGIGMRLMSHGGAARSAVTPPAATTTLTTPAVPAAPPAAAAAAATEVVTPSSLPDARTTPASLPDAPVVRAPVFVAAPPVSVRPRPPASEESRRGEARPPSTHAAAADSAEASPTALTDALR